MVEKNKTNVMDVSGMRRDHKTATVNKCTVKQNGIKVLQIFFSLCVILSFIWICFFFFSLNIIGTMQLNISGTERETESLYPNANFQHLAPS